MLEEHEWPCSVGRIVAPVGCTGVVGAVALSCQLNGGVLSRGWVKCLVFMYYGYFRTKLFFIPTVF